MARGRTTTARNGTLDAFVVRNKTDVHDEDTKIIANDNDNDSDTTLVAGSRASSNAGGGRRGAQRKTVKVEENSDDNVSLESDSTEVDDSGDEDYTAANSDNETGSRKTRKRHTSHAAPGDEFARHLKEADANGDGLSEYERVRLENIRRNQEMIAKLNLGELGQLTRAASAESAAATAARRKKASSATRSRPKRTHTDINDVPVRRSTRQRGVKSGIDGPIDQETEEIAEKIRLEAEAKAAAEKEALNKFRFGPIPIKVENTVDGASSTTELLHMLQNIAARSSVEEDVKNIGAVSDADDKQMQDLYSRARVSPLTAESIKMNSDRIMSLAMHPDREKLLAISGDKSGAIAFLDFKAFAKSVKNPDINAPVEGLYTLQPHGEGVNDIKLDVADSTKFYSCSYDGTIKLLDIKTTMFDNLYTSPIPEPIQCLSQNPGTGLIYAVSHSGRLICLDTRERRPVYDDVNIALKKLSFVECNPSDPHLVATGGLNYVAQVWDTRFLQTSTNRNKLATAWEEETHDDENRLPGCIWSYHIGRAVNNTSWSPNGKKLVTTSFDNAVRVFDSPHLKGDKFDQSSIITIPHNNKTGKWVSLLRARWNPNGLYDSFLLGNMKRAVDIYSGKTGSMLSMLHDPDVVTAIPAVNSWHPNWSPTDCVWTSGTGTGKVLLWTTEPEKDGVDL